MTAHLPFGAYKTPRLAVFGYLLPFGRAPQKNESGEWFVDINSLAVSMSGKFDPGTRVFSYDKDSIKLQLTDSMFLNPDRDMISLAGLASAGFYCQYRQVMNLVMVERWRD